MVLGFILAVQHVDKNVILEWGESIHKPCCTPIETLLQILKNQNCRQPQIGIERLKAFVMLKRPSLQATKDAIESIYDVLLD